jgi:hypothetical protein
MAVGKGKVRMLGGPAKKVNPIPRDKDNTGDLEKEELRLRSKRKWQAPDASTPGRIVTGPPHNESTMPG